MRALINNHVCVWGHDICPSHEQSDLDPSKILLSRFWPDRDLCVTQGCSSVTSFVGVRVCVALSFSWELLIVWHPCAADETACQSAVARLPFEGQARGRRGAANGLWSLHTLPTAKQISSNEVSNVGGTGWHNPAWQPGPLAARKAALPPALSSALAWPLLPPRATAHGEVPTVNHAGQCAIWHANVGHCICKCVITRLACQDTLARLCSQQAVVTAL